WLAVVEILRRVEREPYRWPIGRVGFQKLAYFATEAGIPTGLSFVPGSFGPSSPDLKRITSRLVNNGLISEEQRGRMIAVRTGGTFQSASQANEAMIRRWDDEIDLVTDLV